MRGGEEYDIVVSLLCFADIASVEALSCLCGCQSRGDYDLCLFGSAGGATSAALGIARHKPARSFGLRVRLVLVFRAVLM